MTIGERIKELRKALNLTQQDLADRIGIKRNSFANYETGRNIPLDAIVVSICREFGASESWLRAGEGPMFVPVNRDEEIAAFIGDVLKGERADFRRQLISVLARMTPDEWELVERKAQELVRAMNDDTTTE